MRDTRGAGVPAPFIRRRRGDVLLAWGTEAWCHGAFVRDAMKPLIRYAMVGAVATLAHYAVLAVAVERGWMAPAPAAALGAWVGAQVAYALNVRFTFAGARMGFASWWRFQATAAIGAVLSFGIVAVGVTIGLHYLVAQAVATVLAMGVTYAVNRRWSFGATTARRP